MYFLLLPTSPFSGVLTAPSRGMPGSPSTLLRRAINATALHLDIVLATVCVCVCVHRAIAKYQNDDDVAVVQLSRFFRLARAPTVWVWLELPVPAVRWSRSLYLPISARV